VLPSAEVVARVAAEFPLLPLGAQQAGETAQRWRYADGGGEIGVISSVTQAFCTTATARGSPRRQALPLPVREPRPRLRALLREGRTDAEISGGDRRRLERRATAIPTGSEAGVQRRPRRRAPRRDALHRRMNPALITGLVLAGGQGRRMGGRTRACRPSPAPRWPSTRCSASRRGGPHDAQREPHLDAYRALACRSGPMRCPTTPVRWRLLAGLLHCETPLLVTVPCERRSSARSGGPPV